MADNPIRNIVVGGEAGQGLVTVGSLLSRALVRAGYRICVTQSYLSRIRGGHNTFAIRVGTDDVAAPQEGIDLLVALDGATIAMHEEELLPGAVVMADVSHATSCNRCLKVPLKELASKRYENVAALGVVAKLLGLEREVVESVISTAFGKKGPQVVADNMKALDAAYAWAAAQQNGKQKLPPPASTEKRLLMNGNDAIALGAMSAGVKFCSFYPMTPATSINLALAANAAKMGIVVEQAEDEIAAINMAVGASYAGAPAIVATSGGGFALMVEGVSLAAMIETPVVIVVSQRPGPATGLPTRTEQADLEFVLFSGHGEFPRALFAPGSVESCFALTRRAFELAERYQGPVFILTDQFLADSDRAALPFDVENLPPVKAGCDPESVEVPYRRFALTESGVSPRLLPGLSKHLVVADSDEHTEDGHLTEDLAVRKLMVEKRLKKLAGLEGKVLPPAYAGDADPDILFVSWGSTQGAVAEAARTLRLGGRKTATLSFEQVWPLVSSQFVAHLRKAGQVVIVEGNATGQFAKLIRRESGFEIKRRVLRYDGLPMTPEYILRAMSS